MKKTEESALKLKVTEALSKDVGRAYARMGPEDLEKLRVAIGDIVEVVGKRTTVAKAMPAYNGCSRKRKSNRWHNIKIYKYNLIP